MSRSLITALLLSLSAVAQAQTGPRFEVTSVKPILEQPAGSGGSTLPPQAFQLLENSSLSAIPDALKSLGLLLQPRRAPLDVVVIDSIDKTPAEN